MGACNSSYSLNKDYKTYDKFMQDFKESGAYEDVNLIIGIDCTKSNETSGMKTFGSHMHDLSKENPYMSVMKIMTSSLKQDKDSSIPLYFFGSQEAFGEKDTVLHVGDCKDINELQGQYRSHIINQTLSGPTTFSGLIDKTIQLTDLTKKFHLLLIITDGDVSDIAIDSSYLDKASNYPMAISCIGVGDGPFKKMEDFDDEKTKLRLFDNFQFTSYDEIRKKEIPSQMEKQLFFKAFSEVPSQYRSVINKLKYSPFAALNNNNGYHNNQYNNNLNTINNHKPPPYV
jgi:E3 ubiquitin-protein ligase RGLG